jgi:hypothetical protein
MKKFIILLLIAALPLALSAKKSNMQIEVKEGEGIKSNLINYDGPVHKSKYTKKFPYVCYEKRIKIELEGEVLLKYKGCFRVDVSCKSIGRAHFGKYPNDYKAYKALKRCLRAAPKFVD